MRFKISTVLVAVVICIILSFGVSADKADYSVKTVAGLTLGYTENDLTAVADIIGMTAKSLKEEAQKNNVLFIAVNSDNTVQIRLSRYKTAFSEKTDNIADVSDKLLAELSGDITKNGYEKTNLGGTAFLKVSEKLSDNGGNYLSEQYITVKNKNVYHISVYISENVERKNADEFLSGIKLYEKTVYSDKQKIIIASVITALIVLIGFMTVGIIRDLKSK